MHKEIIRHKDGSLSVESFDIGGFWTDRSQVIWDDRKDGPIPADHPAYAQMAAKAIAAKQAKDAEKAAMDAKAASVKDKAKSDKARLQDLIDLLEQKGVI